MKRLMMATVLAGVVSAATLQTSAVTATWTGGNGAWETASNWDIGAVPGPTTNVQFNSSSMPEVKVSSSPTVQSIYVASSGNSGPQFTLGADKKLTVSGPVTNFNIVSYSGGAYSFDGNLIVGRKKAWGDQTSNKKTTFQGGAVADIGGIVWVTGYAGNGLVVKDNSFVTCSGYQDEGGTRNATLISGGGVFHSKGKITIYDGYPNTLYPEPFTVDGGIVTNEGALVIAEGGYNAAAIPLKLKNAAKWRQYGKTTIGYKTKSNSLQVLSGSTFESTDDILIAATTPTSPTGQDMRNNRLVVDGGSTLTATNLTVGGANNQYGLWVAVTDHSSATFSGECAFGPKWNLSGTTLVVDDSSTFSANSMTWGAGGYANDMAMAVTNSSLTVAGAVNLPALTNCKSLEATFVGTAENPATGDFPGGLCIGAGSTGWIGSSKATRTVPTMLLISNATVTVGKVVDGTSSGDMRIGAYNVAGVTDLATNRVVISGAKGCIVAKHRFVTTGTGAIEFHVPQGGYQNEYKCAIRPKQGLLANAEILIDLSEVKPTGEWQEYVLVDATSDLTVKKEKISVVAPEKSRYKIVSTDKKLSVRVKANCGLVVVFR